MREAISNLRRVKELGVGDIADRIRHEAKGITFHLVFNSAVVFMRKVIMNHLKTKEQVVDYASTRILLDSMSKTLATADL